MNKIKSADNNIHEAQNIKAEPKKQVGAKDLEKFNTFMQDKEQGKKILQQVEVSDQAKNTYGQNILASLMGNSQDITNVQTSEQINASSVREIDTDTLNKLVDNILVASSENKNEVRINVKNDILHDTQIILRLEEGKLFVEMQTKNNDSALILHQNVDNLTARLHASCKNTEIGVSIVELDRNTDNKQGDSQSDQRSRGNFLWKDEA